MSKKKNNSNVNTEAVDQVVETPVEATVEEVPVEETDKATVEEADPVEDTKVEEKAEEVSIENSIPAVEEVKEDLVPVEIEEEPKVEDPVDPVEEPAPDTAKIVPVEEGEGGDNPVDYFVQLNKEPFSEEKFKMVEERLAKYDLAHFVSAEGIVLVGPYVTKDGAINGRRLVIRCGLKGDIVSIPKDNV